METLKELDMTRNAICNERYILIQIDVFSQIEVSSFSLMILLHNL